MLYLASAGSNPLGQTCSVNADLMVGVFFKFQMQLKLLLFLFQCEIWQFFLP